jgi:hypothetical protein
MVEMSCRYYRNGLIELARGARIEPSERDELNAHLERCGPCRTAFHAQVRLSDAAMMLAAEAASIQPPVELEKMMLAEFDRKRVKPPRRAPYWAAAGALAASLVAGWAGQAWMRQAGPSVKRPTAVLAPVTIPAKIALPQVQATPRQSPRPRMAKRRPRPPATENAATAAITPENDAPFVPIPYTAPLGPYERADVIRVELPVSALIAAGLPFQVSDPGARARADLVVSEDGRARAVRLISISDPGSYRSIR